MPCAICNSNHWSLHLKQARETKDEGGNGHSQNWSDLFKVTQKIKGSFGWSDPYICPGQPLLYAAFNGTILEKDPGILISESVQFKCFVLAYDRDIGRQYSNLLRDLPETRKVLKENRRHSFLCLQLVPVLITTQIQELWSKKHLTHCYKTRNGKLTRTSHKEKIILNIK